jgi:hypothetical protein
MAVFASYESFRCSWLDSYHLIYVILVRIIFDGRVHCRVHCIVVLLLTGIKGQQLGIRLNPFSDLQSRNRNGAHNSIVWLV